MKLYRVTNNPLPIIGGRAERNWMDMTSQKYAYRCLPMTIANSTGWEFITPQRIVMTYRGGNAKEAIEVREGKHLAHSHFGDGIVTFHTGYLIRTDPDDVLWVRGAPNFFIDGLAPLDGIVETNWAPYTFTMNWKFTRPGQVIIEAGDPICFIMPFNHNKIDEIVPEIHDIKDNPELQNEYQEWTKSRSEFIMKLRSNDEEANKQKWQKDYFKGKNLATNEKYANHVHKRRLPTPILKG